MTNLSNLFENARNQPLEFKTKELLKGLPIDLFNVFNEAKLLTNTEAQTKPLGYRSRNFMTEIMYGNVVGILRQNYPESICLDKHGRPYLPLGENIRLYFKKLSKKRTPNNIITKNVTKMNSQSLFGEEGMVNVVYAGFILNGSDWTGDFKEVLLVYIDLKYQRTPLWTVDLSDAEFRRNVVPVTYMSQPQLPQIDETTLVSVKREAQSAAG